MEDFYEDYASEMWEADVEVYEPGDFDFEDDSYNDLAEIDDPWYNHYDAYDWDEV